MIDHCSLNELADRLAAGGVGEVGSVLVVDLDDREPPSLPTLHAGVAWVVVGTTAAEDPASHPARAVCDVVVAAGDPVVGSIAESVGRHPLAAAALVRLLRGREGRSLEAGLVAESASYSALQAGPELAAWLASRAPRPRAQEGAPVRVERDGDHLHITLTRPHVRNALDTTMRDALVEAFLLPALDPSIAEVHLRGEGASFCAGGDLDGFGTFPDPATAHVVRLQQSVGRAIARVAGRVTAHLHGACVGSGIELPAFAGRVLADPSTSISLPEVSMGLIPGAGGTVSLPARIGRQRTARLALSGEAIDATTARAWGLVDEIVDDLADRPGATATR